MTGGFLREKDWDTFIGLYLLSKRKVVPGRHQEPKKCVPDRTEDSQVLNLAHTCVALYSLLFLPPLKLSPFGQDLE